MCDNDDANAIAYLIDRVNDWGYDAIEIGDVLACTWSARSAATSRTAGWPGAIRMAWPKWRARLPSARGSATSWPRARQGRREVGPSRVGMHVKGQASRPTTRAASKAWHRLCHQQPGACHLRGYTPAAEVVGNVLGPSTVVEPAGLERQRGDGMISRTSTP